MKKYIIIAAGVALSLGSCKDFQEINEDPNAVPESEMQIDYMLNTSIFQAQMDPNIAERIFILYWDRAARYERSGGLTLFNNNDDWNSQYWGGAYMNRWIKDVTIAIQIGDRKISSGLITAQERNLYQMARIWRAYLYGQYSDNFGPVAIGNYDGTVPDMSSVEDVYAFILSELSEASAALDPSVVLTDRQIKNDLIFAGDARKWQQYANSMRLRYALRIDDQAAFVAATTDPAGLITTVAGIASVSEKGGYSPASGVMSLTFDVQPISLTYANLTTGLGGITLSQIAAIPGTAAYGMDAATIAKYSKDPADYLGLRMNGYLATSTNVANAGYLMDYLPSKIDPRTLVNFSIPGYNDGTVQNYPYSAMNGGGPITKLLLANSTSDGVPVPKPVADTVLFRAQYTLLAQPGGNSGKLGTNFTQFTNQEYNLSTKSKKLRDNNRRRVFFGPWETYFLLAEASLKGWNVGITDGAAYTAGVKASFDYYDISSLADAYLASEDYNRVGTSVSYAHTTEIASAPMQTVDFESNLVPVSVNGDVTTYAISENPTITSVVYKYPRGAYGTNNDKLTKIITQKYIANSPWLPLEAWSDYRRLNLPFMENPVIEVDLPFMPWYSRANSGEWVYKNVPQRLIYPANLTVSNPAGYASGVRELGGTDAVSTALSWAKQN